MESDWHSVALRWRSSSIWVYPRKPSPPSEAAQRMRTILDGFGPIAPEELPRLPS